MPLRIGRGGQVEAPVAGQPLAVAQDARIGLALHRRQERVPDHPGSHAAALECGARVGRAQVGGLDVADRQPGAGQRFEQQVMRAGALGEGDALALELRNFPDRGVLPHDDGLRLGRGRFDGVVGQVGARGKREGRHRVGHVGAQVQIADVEGFEQRQAGGEFIPLHRRAQRRQRLFQRLARLEQDHQRRRFLEADAQRVPCRLRVQRQRRHARGDHASRHDPPPPLVEALRHCHSSSAFIGAMSAQGRSARGGREGRNPRLLMRGDVWPWPRQYAWCAWCEWLLTSDVSNVTLMFLVPKVESCINIRVFPRAVSRQACRAAVFSCISSKGINRCTHRTARGEVSPFI